MKRTKISNEEFLSRMKAINENIEFLEEFPGTAYRIKCRCKVCGNEWSPISGGLLSGDGCRVCWRRSKQMSSEEFNKRLSIIQKDILIIGEYTGTKNRIPVKCCVCGNKWNPLARKLLEGIGCPKCAIDRKKLSQESFVQRVLDANFNNEVIGQYTGTANYVLTRCKVCGYEWNANSAHLLNGRGCPKCSNHYTLTNEEFIEKLEYVNSDITPLDNYINTYTKIRFQCKLCDHIWSAIPKTAMKGHGCPICNASRGERRIAKYLNDNGIKFTRNMEYDGLVGLRDGQLSYDFYLHDYNILIEYQGGQHEFPVDFNGDGKAEEKFEKQQEHDRRKREYAKSHCIDLLEIWHYEFDEIENILENYLGNKLAA